MVEWWERGYSIQVVGSQVEGEARIILRSKWWKLREEDKDVMIILKDKANSKKVVQLYKH